MSRAISQMVLARRKFAPLGSGSMLGIGASVPRGGLTSRIDQGGKRSVAEILGLGVTHYPGLAMQGNLAARVKNFKNDPLLPQRYRDPSTWPAPMREEWR